ncbi:hypothetical protein Ahy_B03g062747 isoform E [Arachis hypogaea]|uniref:Ubiquitin-like protease family profile domain-containing protein n=1 Tax=Arachis hypogaea TaxID=3818 RepID=A0A444ZV64_ARAHY|nr:hypothetical protein Ahy_B03g062747 isoform E [Arachis hypogaea]
MDQQREPNSNSQKKRRLDLDWEALLPRHGDAPPPEIVVKPMASGNSFSLDDEFRYYTDHQLIESIQSKKQTLRIHLPMLKDGGVKILDTIKRQEEELARRRRTPHVQNRKLLMLMINREMLLAQVMLVRFLFWLNQSCGVSSDSRQKSISSQVPVQPSFASCFSKKLEGVDTDCMVVDTSGKETSHFRHCNNETIKDKGEPKGGRRLRSSSRNEPFQCATNLSKNDAFNDGKKSRAASSISAANIGKSLSRFFAPEVYLRRKLDRQFNQMTRGPRSAKDAKMYYPSSDDPESVEICYSDIDCLAPESYLTSTIMNFYIRYLKQQASLANRSLSEYHFFNTYFYKKLQEAVSVKQSDRATFFVKFRRWWKGVNIFQKTYVLIPVHEDRYFSYVLVSTGLESQIQLNLLGSLFGGYDKFS